MVKKIVPRKTELALTKIGLFVTFWKRKPGEEIESFTKTDYLDFFIVNVE